MAKTQSPIKDSKAVNKGGSFVERYFLAVLSLFACMSLFLIATHRQNFLEHEAAYLPEPEGIRPNKKRAKQNNKQQGSLLPGKLQHYSHDAETAISSSSLDASSAKTMLAGLRCADHGGPSDDIARSMVYWEDIPSDNRHVSPFKKKGVPQYLTFEPDHGGWNNIRMALETTLALAVAMGRTLVLPPVDRFYLLGKDRHTADGSKQRNSFSFEHFFHMEAIQQEHVGLDIITMEEFLKREGLTGHLVNQKTGKVEYPPNKQTNWDGQSKAIFTWLRNHAHLTIWDPDECMAVFPAEPGPESLESLKATHAEMMRDPPKWEDFVDNPAPVNAPTLERMREHRAGRREMCIYDKTMQDALVVHFPADHEMLARLLVHSYAFLFFQDWRHDLWMKRFIRDHVRYIDDLQCAAARVVDRVRQRARKRDPTNKKGIFDTLHIRRGDFQYKKTRVDAEEIYKQAKKQIPDSTTVFVATDEKDLTFFDPLRKHYDLVFLTDCIDLLPGINSNYFGMLDQLIATQGRTFIGCWFSTFTGFINRMRGYHADNQQLPGYEMGIINSWFYVPESNYDHMQRYYPVKQSFFAREFPVSWRLIDYGRDEEGAMIGKEK